MSPIRAILALAAVLVLSTPAYADPRSFVYTTIEYPGATFTQAFGVNAAGDVVGTYRDASGRQHGFLLSAGVYTSIDYPGAVLTDARGIGPGGEIVGAYRLAGEPGVAFHGYLRARDGQFTPLDFPGHPHTIPQRLLANGTVVGCYHDNDTMHSMHRR